MNIDEVLDINEVEIPKEAPEKAPAKKPIKLNLDHPVWLFYIGFFSIIGFLSFVALITAIIIQL